MAQRVAKKAGGRTTPAKTTLTAIDGGAAKVVDLDAELNLGVAPSKRVKLFGQSWRLGIGPNVLALADQNEAEFDIGAHILSYIATPDQTRFRKALLEQPGLGYEQLQILAQRLAEVLVERPTARS